MRRTNTENPDTSTAKQHFFDRTLALHTDCLGVSCRVQANALIDRRAGLIVPRSTSTITYQVAYKRTH
jgi:hypothetical protein